MITITKGFDGKNQTRNPVWIEGNTDKYAIDASGGYWELDLTSTPANNDSFTVVLCGVSLTITFKTTADPLLFEVTRPSSNPNWDQMVLDFASIYHIARYFDITESYLTKTIRFTEKVAGGASLNGGITIHAGSYSSTYTASTPLEYRRGYKLVAELHRQQDPAASVENNLVAAIDTLPGDTGDWQLFCDHALRALVGPSRPLIDDNKVVECPEMLAYFNLLLYEQYGNQTDLTPVMPRFNMRLGSAADYPRAFYGGPRRRLWLQAGYEWEGNYISRTDGYNYFLTYHTGVRSLPAEAPLWLYLYVPESHTEARIRYTIVYTDKTTATGTIYAHTLGTHTGTLLRMLAGFNALELNTLSSKTAVKYTLSVENQSGTRISQEVTYAVQSYPTPGSLYLLWENTFGAYETLWCTGYTIQGAKSISSADRYAFPAEYADGEYAHGHKEKQYTITARTGLLTRPEADALQDLLTAPTILLYNTELQRLEPVIIETRELPVWNEGENVNAWELDFSLSRTE